MSICAFQTGFPTRKITFTNILRNKPYLKIKVDFFLLVQIFVFFEFVDDSLLIILLISQMQLLAVSQKLFVQFQYFTFRRHYYFNILKDKETAHIIYKTT